MKGQRGQWITKEELTFKLNTFDLPGRLIHSSTTCLQFTVILPSSFEVGICLRICISKQTRKDQRLILIDAILFGVLYLLVHASAVDNVVKSQGVNGSENLWLQVLLL